PPSLHWVVIYTRVPLSISERTACSSRDGIPPAPKASRMTLGYLCRAEKNVLSISGVSLTSSTCGSIVSTKEGSPAACGGVSQWIRPVSPIVPARGAFAETNASASDEWRLHTLL